jgi:hypothetical protein
MIGSRFARLAPLKPLSCALRASTRRDAFSVLPAHLEMRNEPKISPCKILWGLVETTGIYPASQFQSFV